ncbi:MAG: MOSC domain-containing protein [Pseudomonas sp.]
MSFSAQILSISVARSRSLEVGGRSRQTGLFKQPLEGAVWIDSSGVKGDVIVNRKFHGGPDQAVYLYSKEDIDWWAGRLQREIGPGFFGENLCISHWWPEVRVGDRLRIGQLQLEITAPRVPCAVMAARVGYPGFAKEFVKAARCGAYARVLQPGSISAGDALEVAPAPSVYPTVDEIFRYWHGKGRNADFLRRVLAAPVASILRVALEEQLLQAEAGTGQLPGI